MDYLIIGILFFIGNVIWSIAFLFYQSYAKKKGENIAVKEDSEEIAMLTELGKNIATKKDIGDITKEIESVKSTFATETEKLKANLLLLAGVQYGIISEERNAIIEFIKSLYNLENSIFRVPTKFTDNNAIEQEIENINNAHYFMKCNQALFNLYIEDNELKIRSLELIKEISKHENITQKSYREIIVKNIEIELIQKEEYENTKAKREVMCKAFQERSNIYSNAQKESIDLYTSYIKDRATFENKCRTRIYKLLEPEQ